MPFSTSKCQTEHLYNQADYTEPLYNRVDLLWAGEEGGQGMGEPLWRKPFSMCPCWGWRRETIKGFTWGHVSSERTYKGQRVLHWSIQGPLTAAWRNRTRAQCLIYAGQPTLFNSVTYAFRANQSCRLSSQSLCGRTSECPGSPVFSSPLQGLALNNVWNEHISERLCCLNLVLMATYLLNFKSLSSTLCA